MKTFTNYATKAKQFLNLLQGYTKGIRITAILILLLMGVSNAWGYTISSAKIYYDDSNSKWGSNVVVAFDKNDGGAVFAMTKINNTSLHYWTGTWGDGAVSYMRFGQTTKTYNWYGWWDSVKNTWALSQTDKWTGVSNGWGIDINNASKMFGAKSNSSGADLTKTDLTSSYSTLNYTQTIKTAVNGADANSKATITVTSYNLTGHGTISSQQSASISTSSKSTTISAARTATTTLTVGDVATGYQFDGWYAAKTGGTALETSTTYTYYPTAATTVYARFSEKKYTVTVNNDGHGTTTPSGAQSNVGQVTGLSINATPAANYEFVNWTITSGSGSFGSTTNASTTFKPTSDATIQANFRSTVTYSLTVVAGNGISQVTGSEDPVTLGSKYDIKATPKTGYTFSTWTANPVENATFGSATTANTTVTVKNGSVTVTASATEIMSTLTTSNKYDAGDPGYDVPSATASKIGIATTATVTATAAGNGYTFTGWTLTNCTRTDGGAADATSITVRSNGDGKAATVVANYAEDLTTSWVLKGSFVDDFKTAYDFTKKTGESTGTVAYVTLELAANTAYRFKVVNGDTWFGNNNSNEQYWIKATAENWNFYSDAGDCHMKSSVAGTYTFKIDFSGTNPKVSIQFPTAYTLTYGSGAGGSGTVTANNSIKSGDLVLAGTSVSLTATPADGYDFAAWYSDQACEGDVVSSNNPYNFSINSNTTLYAKWKAQSFTLTWELDGGKITEEGTQAGSVATGTPLTPPIVTKDHYDHTGWTPEEPTVMPGEDVTYTAQWTPKEYTITYNLNGGNGTMTPTKYTIESETFTLPKNPTKAGHTFAGWYANAELTGDAVTQIEKGSTGDKAYWAKWNVETYTITFDQQSGSDGTPSVTAQYGAKLSAITIPSRDGYLFDGYYTQTGGKGTKYYNADGTTTKNMPHNISKLYANWIGYDHCIFFKNTLGWQEVYVYTFTNNAYWDDGTGVHPATNKLEQGKMTQVGKTDIYYYILTDLTGFSYIAFSDFDMRTYGFFNDHQAVYRGDRNDQLQLFIPQKDQTPTGDTYTTNKYYNDGIWMKYNSKDSGYDWSGKTADSDWSDHSLLAEKKGDYSFTTTVLLTAGTNYEFKISNVGKDADNAKIKETAWYGWSGTMTQANCTNKHFKHNTSNNAMITPTVNGDYTFTVYLGDGKVMVSLEYPLSTWDYRLAYNDITLSKIHEGHYLKKRTTGEILDTVSFFVRKDKTPQILLQQCTEIVGGKPTWATVNNGTYNITVNADGVYNFVLKQTNSGTHNATLETSATHKYTGDYYVRTDAAEGGWKSYRQASNRMNYSTYADSHSEFNHYFCSYREAGCNVKFIVANDYSECLTETMDNDDIIKPNQSSVGCLPENANVRFGWNSKTNELTRAYISGAGLVQDRFLVLMGNEYLKDAEGKALVEGTNGSPRYGLKANEEIFADKGNWIYQVDVQACNQTTIRLSALYNGQEQLFKGARNDISLLNSTEPKYYKVRMIYDFKTNHMISAWLLDEQGNTIEGEGSLASDILVIRKNQDQANQLTFTEGAKRTDVGVVYGVMTFDKFFLNNIDKEGNAVAQKDEKTIYERALYWISFPFNVKLKDIFGFSNYGDHWILEKYNGQARAENGAWVDSESYWEYITDSEYELEAGKGYVLCLDLDKMGVNSDVFQHTDEVSLYFPSKEKLGTINGDPTPITLDPYTCIIKRDNRDIYDSNWHLIGVPRFADITTENINIIPQPTQEDVGFYYEYGSNGEYTVNKSGATTFQTMSAYLVQYAGVINWTSTGITIPAAIAARKNSPAEPEQVHLRLEIAQDDEMADQTFVQLQQEGATAEFDMNLDLTKMLHSGTNIYTLAGEQGIKSAGNVMPMSECVVPVGVKVDTDGEYTFRMPDGTEGMVVELIDYYTNTRTNLLLFDYTVDLSAGTCNDRFALHIQPSKSGVTTNIDQLTGSDLNAEGVQKYIIDGRLYLKKNGVLYDAQGHRL